MAVVSMRQGTYLRSGMSVSQEESHTRAESLVGEGVKGSMLIVTGIVLINEIFG